MKVLLLFLPGNPSVPKIYEPFIEEVKNNLGALGEIDSIVLPHLGQCNQNNSDLGNIQVRDVIQNHREKIISLNNELKPDKLFLISHSLGSAISISIYEDLKEIVSHFFILCPFLGPSKNNYRYLYMFKNPVTRTGMKLVTYTGLKNKKVSHFIFNKWLGENPFNKRIPYEIRKPYYIKNFFSLVSNYLPEFEMLNLKSKITKISPENAFFIFAKNDYWVPRESLNYLPKNSNHKILDEIEHDFCLKKEQYQVVASTIGSYLVNA